MRTRVAKHFVALFSKPHPESSLRLARVLRLYASRRHRPAEHVGHPADNPAGLGFGRPTCCNQTREVLCKDVRLSHVRALPSAGFKRFSLELKGQVLAHVPPARNLRRRATRLVIPSFKFDRQELWLEPGNGAEVHGAREVEGDFGEQGVGLSAESAKVFSGEVPPNPACVFGS